MTAVKTLANREIALEILAAPRADLPPGPNDEARQIAEALAETAGAFMLRRVPDFAAIAAGWARLPQTARPSGTFKAESGPHKLALTTRAQGRQLALHLFNAERADCWGLTIALLGSCDLGTGGFDSTDLRFLAIRAIPHPNDPEREQETHGAFLEAAAAETMADNPALFWPAALHNRFQLELETPGARIYADADGDPHAARLREEASIREGARFTGTPDDLAEIGHLARHLRPEIEAATA